MVDLNGDAVVRVCDVESWVKHSNNTKAPTRPARVPNSHSPVKVGTVPLYDGNDSEEDVLKKPPPTMSALIRRIPPPPPPHRPDPIPSQRPAHTRDADNSTWC